MMNAGPALQASRRANVNPRGARMKKHSLPFRKAAAIATVTLVFAAAVTLLLFGRVLRGGNAGVSSKGTRTARGARMVYARSDQPVYGVPQIFEYTNRGAPDYDTACGQAAVCTLLTFRRVFAPDTSGRRITEVYRRYGPDVAWGWLGTSRQRMDEALRGYGVSGDWQAGEDALRATLRQNKPCLLLLDIGTIPDEGFRPVGGHWTVAYAYDSRYVYLTNWPRDGRCTWANLRKSWNTWLTQANGTPNRFLCPD